MTGREMLELKLNCFLLFLHKNEPKRA